jgi:hypothetical protein
VSLIPSLSTLLIGGFEQPEFRAAAEMLVRRTAVRRVLRPEFALAECQTADEFPDLIVLAQSRPGEFDFAALHRLRRWAPLARVISILGSWCAGETRSGTPLTGVVRVYWHEAAAYLTRELEHQQAGRCPDWGLPFTATEFDRVSPVDLEPDLRVTRTIAIHSANCELANWLERTCRAWGYSAAWFRPGSMPALASTAAIIWDAWRLDEAELAQLHARASVPQMVLLDFPHWEDRQRAIEAGATVVLAKPLRLDDLRWHLDRLCESALEATPH